MELEITEKQMEATTNTETITTNLNNQIETNWSLLEDYVKKINDTNTSFASFLQNITTSTSVNSTYLSQLFQKSSDLNGTKEIQLLKDQNKALVEEIRELKAEVDELKKREIEHSHKLGIVLKNLGETKQKEKKQTQPNNPTSIPPPIIAPPCIKPIVPLIPKPIPPNNNGVSCYSPKLSIFPSSTTRMDPSPLA